jgi:hypothetical protein
MANEPLKCCENIDSAREGTPCPSADLYNPLWDAGSAGPTSNMSLEKNRKFVRAEWQVLSAVAYLMGFQVDNWTEYWLINAFRSTPTPVAIEPRFRQKLVDKLLVRIDWWQ